MINQVYELQKLKKEVRMPRVRELKLKVTKLILRTIMPRTYPVSAMKNEFKHTKT